jgi:hypothetical protein
MYKQTYGARTKHPKARLYRERNKFKQVLNQQRLKYIFFLGVEPYICFLAQHL